MGCMADKEQERIREMGWKDLANLGFYDLSQLKTYMRVMKRVGLLGEDDFTSNGYGNPMSISDKALGYIERIGNHIKTMKRRIADYEKDVQWLVVDEEKRTKEDLSKYYRAI